MAWTLPTKVVDHPRALGPSEEILTDTREKFYEDYAGDRNGTSMNELLSSRGGGETLLTCSRRLEIRGSYSIDDSSVSWCFTEGRQDTGKNDRRYSGP